MMTMMIHWLFDFGFGNFHWRYGQFEKWNLEIVMIQSRAVSKRISQIHWIFRSVQFRFHPFLRRMKVKMGLSWHLCAAIEQNNWDSRPFDLKFIIDRQTWTRTNQSSRHTSANNQALLKPNWALVLHLSLSACLPTQQHLTMRYL